MIAKFPLYSFIIQFTAHINGHDLHKRDDIEFPFR
jgi:hypothetical protein